MHLKRLFIVFLLLSLPGIAAAQMAPDARLAEVVVEGTTTFADIVRVVISSRAGTPVSAVDLEAERNRVYALGSFASVSVNLQTRSGQPVLVVTVRENPLVNRMDFEGVEALDVNLLRDFIASEHILAPGRVLNTTRAQEAVATIQAIYRQQGFPFQVPVTLNLFNVVGDSGELETVIEYSVEERPAVEEVVIAGNETIDADAVAGLFRPLTITGNFDIGLYRTAIEAANTLYADEGYRLSGVDRTTTYLEAGILHVNIVERRITAVDTTAIGVEASELSLGVGDLFNYDTLLNDVRRLSTGATGDVRLVAQAIGTAGVRVTFQLGPPETAGAINAIEIRGNTVVDTEELVELLELGIGDTFTSTLAEEDFIRIVERYEELGYIVLATPDFNWVDGTYVQTIHEVTVAGHQVTFEGGRERSNEHIVTRYLPAIGSVVSQNDLRGAMGTIHALGAVEPVNIILLTTPEPDEVIINVIVRETNTGVFTPSAQYSTDSGFSLALSYSQANLWGLAHSAGIELTGQTSPIGLLFGGSIRYSIPWIYVDFLDFLEVPTSLSVAVFSIATSNQVMSAGTSLRVHYPGRPETDDNLVNVGTFTSRESGFNFGVSRPIFPNTTLGVGARIVYTSYMQEPAVTCRFDDDGNIENADSCTLPFDEATQYLPQGGWNTFLSTSLNYDSRDSAEFPREGIAADLLIGFGFGNDFRHPDTDEQTGYNYQQVEVGFRTYLQLNKLLSGLNDRHVLAFRVNFGHQFGDLYPIGRRFLVGRTTIDATAIRGYRSTDFGLSRTYATSSIEYRYDFGLDTFATQTVIGIVFVDIGYASSATGFAEYGAPIFAGAGLGVQVNLGFGGVMLPALRFDYGFSERHPGGEFRFRVSPVF